MAAFALSASPGALGAPLSSPSAVAIAPAAPLTAPSAAVAVAADSASRSAAGSALASLAASAAAGAAVGSRRRRQRTAVGGASRRGGAAAGAGAVVTGPLRGARLRREAVAIAWEAGKQDERTFASKEEFLASVTKEARLPEGFQVGQSSLKFVPKEAPQLGELPMRLTVIRLDEPSDAYAAVFTTNAFPGAPVLVGRRRLAGGKPLQAVVVNNKVSNVFPSDGGEASSEKVCAAAASGLTLAGGAESVLPSSTGVIGWRLPADELAAAMPAAAKALQAGSVLPAAEGIMTTDRYAKVSAAELPGGGRIVGIAKGAGMIEPNMATMLCYILTDATMPEGGRAEFQRMLADAVKVSFNSCSVDGDESTSDTVALISSQRKPRPPRDAFAAALEAVCRDLAAQVVRNGEGTKHVLRVAVTGAADDTNARRIAKAVVNGPLFKSAVAGNDPNVGRLIAKVGQSLGSEGASMAEGAVCRIGGETIFENGRFSLDGAKEERLARHLKSAEADCELDYPPHQRVVDVEVRLGAGGPGKATVLGSDLTKEYVAINGDYRS